MIAVGEGGPTSLVNHGESGLLASPAATELADALLAVIRSPLLGQRLRAGGLAAVGERTWGRSLRQLAAGYRRVAEAGAQLRPGLGRSAPNRSGSR